MSRFEALLESAPDAIVLADSTGRITLVNRRTEELFAYDREELLGEQVELLVPEVAHRAGYAADPRTRELGTDLELYGRRNDGSEFPVEISLGPMRDGDEEHVITIIRDVSERRAAETRFRTLMESAPDAIVLVDSGGRIALINPRTEELFGYEADELLGEEIERLLPEPREEGAAFELHGRRKDGSEFPVEISRSPMTADRQELIITIVREVSQRRAAELERLEFATEQAGHAEAETGRERLASILGEIDAIVWEADPERRRFSFTSERAEDMLGYPLSRWLEEDRFWQRIVHPGDLEPAQLYFREAIGRGEDHEYEYRVRDSVGGIVWVRDQIRVLRLPDGELQLRGVTVDITTRRELEERLLQSQKMDAIGQLAGGLAHDFNNLLVVISGYTELLLARIEDEASLEQLREVKEAAERASSLIDHLLAFARRAPSVVEAVNLNELVRGLEPMLRRVIDEDIALKLETKATLDDVRADRGQLEQVLVNLVINARDAMPLGGEVRIRTSAADPEGPEVAELGLTHGGWIVLTVTDNGSGMTKETKARIFDPFFTTKDHGQGTGLGLSTVYGIIEQGGGKVAVDSELGQGTTITVYLPTARVSEDELIKAEDRTGAPVVLVVEDEPAVRRLVRSVLEADGYRVQEAANGREALEHIEQNSQPIDLILTDVVMPEVNGPELVARLTALGHRTRVLFMSGYADSKLLSRGLDDGTMKILRKPFTSEELTARVSELVAPEVVP